MSAFIYIELRDNPSYHYADVLSAINYNFSIVTGGTGGSGATTYVKAGTNITTGGTITSPIVSVVASPSFNNLTFSGTGQFSIVSATTVSAATFFSGTTSIATIIDRFSTRVQVGSNITTGGTPNAPTVSITASPSLNALTLSGAGQFAGVTVTSISGGTVSGGTFYSGSTPLQTIIQNLSTGGSTTIQPTQVGFGNSLSALTGSTGLTYINSANTLSIGGYYSSGAILEGIQGTSYFSIGASTQYAGYTALHFGTTRTNLNWNIRVGNTGDMALNSAGRMDFVVGGGGGTIQLFYPTYSLMANPLFLGNSSFSTLPTAILHLYSGTTAANSAPLKFSSGELMTTPEVGAVEFLTNKYYGTITTGASRKEFTLNNIALTSGRLPFTVANGRLSDSSRLTYDDSTGNLQINSLTSSTTSMVVADSSGILSTQTIPATTVQPGTNIATGGTVSAPIVSTTANLTVRTITFSGSVSGSSSTLLGAETLLLRNGKTVGTANLLGGTATVNTSSIHSSDSVVFLTIQSLIGPSNPQTLYINNIVNNTSFQIVSPDGTDNSIVGWLIIKY